MRSPYALSALISNPRGIPIAAFEDLNGGILRNNDPDTDSLGFYLSSPKSRKTLTNCMDATVKNNEEGIQTTEGKNNVDVELSESLLQKEPSDLAQHFSSRSFEVIPTTPIKEVFLQNCFLV